MEDIIITNLKYDPSGTVGKKLTGTFCFLKKTYTIQNGEVVGDPIDGECKPETPSSTPSPPNDSPISLLSDALSIATGTNTDDAKDTDEVLLALERCFIFNNTLIFCKKYCK